MQKGLLLLKPFTGHVYRGYRATTLPRAGESWTAHKFFSMSKQKSKAKPSMNKGFGSYRLLVSMQSVAGRDLGTLSMIPGEAEVVMPQGSTFSVAGAPVRYAAGGDNAYKVTWTNHG